MPLNPATGIDKIQRPAELEDAHRKWEDSEAQVTLDRAKGGLWVAVALGMFAALRMGKARTIKWKEYDGSALLCRQKNRQQNWLPVLPELKQILDAIPRRGPDDTIVVGKLGKPYTKNGLAHAFRDLIRTLEEEGLVAPGLHFHGLRHTAASLVADRGGDIHTIQAVLGDKTEAMALYYSKQADRKRAAVNAAHVGTRQEHPSGKHRFKSGKLNERGAKKLNISMPDGWPSGLRHRS
jgi:integrase